MAEKIRPKQEKHEFSSEVKKLTLEVIPSGRDGFCESGSYYSTVLEWLDKKHEFAELHHLTLVYIFTCSFMNLAFGAQLIELGRRSEHRRFRALNGPHGWQRLVIRPGIDIVVKKKESRGIFNISVKEWHYLERVHFDHKVRFVMPEPDSCKELSVTTSAPKRIAESEFSARFNTPELIQRRAATIATDNRNHTTESDDALENLLKDFESLNFRG